MPRTTTFAGDLTDQELVRAKLEDVEGKIERREHLRDRIEDDLEALQRLRQGLLVILGEREAETNQARAERLDKKHKQDAHFRTVWARSIAAGTIQAQVDSLVDALEREVSAGDLLEHLPADTKRETVNYALWSAASKGRIKRVSQGVYAPLTNSKAERKRTDDSFDGHEHEQFTRPDRSGGIRLRHQDRRDGTVQDRPFGRARSADRRL